MWGLSLTRILKGRRVAQTSLNSNVSFWQLASLAVSLNSDFQTPESQTLLLLFLQYKVNKNKHTVVSRRQQGLGGSK